MGMGYTGTIKSESGADGLESIPLVKGDGLGCSVQVNALGSLGLQVLNCVQKELASKSFSPAGFLNNESAQVGRFSIPCGNDHPYGFTRQFSQEASVGILLSEDFKHYLVLTYPTNGFSQRATKIKVFNLDCADYGFHIFLYTKMVLSMYYRVSS
jgi:hypothetical protein